jgi:hypothetical protein
VIADRHRKIFNTRNDEHKSMRPLPVGSDLPTKVTLE